MTKGYGYFYNQIQSLKSQMNGQAKDVQRLSSEYQDEENRFAHKIKHLNHKIANLRQKEIDLDD